MAVLTFSSVPWVPQSTILTIAVFDRPSILSFPARGCITLMTDLQCVSCPLLPFVKLTNVVEPGHDSGRRESVVEFLPWRPDI